MRRSFPLNNTAWFVFMHSEIKFRRGAIRMTMQVHREALLPCAPDDAWRKVLRSDLLAEVSWPIVTFSATSDLELPEIWRQGTTIRLNCRLFGVLPLATRTLCFEQIDKSSRCIQTREHDQLIRRWDHLISIDERDDGTTLYSDTVDIDAGVLTLPVWLFAKWFYRHRQRRWQRVAYAPRHPPLPLRSTTAAVFNCRQQFSITSTTNGHRRTSEH